MSEHEPPTPLSAFHAVSQKLAEIGALSLQAYLRSSASELAAHDRTLTSMTTVNTALAQGISRLDTTASHASGSGSGSGSIDLVPTTTPVTATQDPNPSIPESEINDHAIPNPIPNPTPQTSPVTLLHQACQRAFGANARFKLKPKGKAQNQTGTATDGPSSENGVGGDDSNGADGNEMDTAFLPLRFEFAEENGQGSKQCTLTILCPSTATDTTQNPATPIPHGYTARAYTTGPVFTRKADAKAAAAALAIEDGALEFIEASGVKRKDALLSESALAWLSWAAEDVADGVDQPESSTSLGKRKREEDDAPDEQAEVKDEDEGDVMGIGTEVKPKKKKKQKRKKKRKTDNLEVKIEAESGVPAETANDAGSTRSAPEESGQETGSREGEEGEVGEQSASRTESRLVAAADGDNTPQTHVPLNPQPVYPASAYPIPPVPYHYPAPPPPSVFPIHHPAYPNQHPAYPIHPAYSTQHPTYPNHPAFPNHPAYSNQHPGFPNQHPVYPTPYPLYPNHPAYPHPPAEPRYNDQHPAFPNQHPPFVYSMPPPAPYWYPGQPGV